MSSINKVQLIARLGKDPEQRFMPSGESICNFSVATSESWKDKQSGEKKEATEWHNIVMFGKVSEIAAQYLRKGALVYLEGKLKTRKWKDKNEQDRYTTEVHCHEMKMLGGRQDGEGGGRDANNSSSRPAAAPAPRPQQGGGRQKSDLDDDIPF